MPRQPARALEAVDVRRLLAHARTQRHSDRNAVIILLSFKAGLRACEIAGLTWAMVLASTGSIGDELRIARNIAKGGSGRAVPMHKDLGLALARLHRAQGRPRDGPVVLSERGGSMSARSVVNWFGDLYRQLDLPGCSSHSGRRTFITRAARLLTASGGSLRDVQELAGHRALTTTERYIQGSREAQRKLIRRL